MSLLNEFFYTTTHKTPYPRAKAPRSDKLQSSGLFQQILSDIAEEQYGLAPYAYDAGEIWETDAAGASLDNPGRIAGVTLMINPDLPVPVQVSEGAKIREMLRDIQVEDLDNRLGFDIHNGCVVYETKMDLYNVLKSFMHSADNKMRTPDQVSSNFHYHRGVPKNIQCNEYVSANVNEVRKVIDNNEQLAADIFFAVPCKPYLSEQHYLFASGVAGIAPVVVSMEHLLKTICLEDGLPIPQATTKTDIPGCTDSAPLLGGYN